MKLGETGPAYLRTCTHCETICSSSVMRSKKKQKKNKKKTKRNKKTAHKFSTPVDISSLKKGRNSAAKFMLCVTQVCGCGSISFQELSKDSWNYTPAGYAAFRYSRYEYLYQHALLCTNACCVYWSISKKYIYF